MDALMRGLTRRNFLLAAGVGNGLWLSGCAEKAVWNGGGEGEGAAGGPVEVSPNEDLMREHGVLDRVLLVYEEALRRLEGAEDLSPGILAQGADIVRRFIEDYHEKLEEDFLFPRFEKAGRLTGLVTTLRAQHGAGRSLTEAIRRLATAADLREEGTRRQIGESIRSFIRMYRPHAAREDTVLFPALRGLVSREEYDALGETFEEEERRRFGQDGFEAIVEEVSRLEASTGIDDLSRFTPSR